MNISAKALRVIFNSLKDAYQDAENAIEIYIKYKKEGNVVEEIKAKKYVFECNVKFMNVLNTLYKVLGNYTIDDLPEDVRYIFIRR